MKNQERLVTNSHLMLETTDIHSKQIFPCTRYEHVWRSRVPLFLNFDSMWRTVVSTKFTPGEGVLYTPEWVWTLEKINSFVIARIRTPDRPARSLDTILTELSQLFRNMFRYKKSPPVCPHSAYCRNRCSRKVTPTVEIDVHVK